jgi:putative colanic acid biosynthesis UDP-glucose lipid carrier transferase
MRRGLKSEVYDGAILSYELKPRANPATSEPGAPARSRSKRLMDVTVAAGILFVLLPLLIVIALMIRLESNGPALFRQRRGGIFGKPILVYKFRTMRAQEDGLQVRQATRNDSRVTRLGAFLRRTSIDELPQLINVLKGDMSLVGPRPHALAHDSEFQALLPDYARRFAVRPGITGLAQVSGYRGETIQIESLKGRLECDLEYIRTWSLASDVKLLIATLKVPLDRRAY